MTNLNNLDTIIDGTDREIAQLEGVSALARTVADELLQPLTVIKAELDLAMMFDSRLDEATIERLYNAVQAMTERVRTYQTVRNFQTVSPIPELSHYKLLVV